MDRKITAYKRKYDSQLRHIKVILMHARSEMPSDQWMRLVYETKRCVRDNVSEFLCGELPERRVLMASIDLVFKSFLDDQRVRDTQRRASNKTVRN